MSKKPTHVRDIVRQRAVDEARAKPAPANRAEQRAKRDGGKFVKGVSGNPAGRPKVVEHIRELARLHTPLALATLVEICQTGDKDSARVSAATELLNRAWGKAPQEISGPNGAAIPIEVQQMPDEQLEAVVFRILTQKKGK